MSNNAHRIVSYLRHFLAAKRRGHGVHSPFAYTLCEEIFYNKKTFYDFEVLNLVRQQLLKDERVITVQDFGAGSSVFKSDKRSIGKIAQHGISNQKQSEIIYKLINFFNCSNCLEIGTSIGLNSMYMAMANRNGTVTSIEGSEALCDAAQELGSETGVQNIHYINSNFEQALPELAQQNSVFDLIYMDGNHRFDATIRYFEWILKMKHYKTVIIVDDIYWSDEMTGAWELMQNHAEVTMCLDCFDFGLLFFDTAIKEKVRLKLLL